MVKLSEIQRTSTFAWSHDTLALLATGTVAGAVDANFNSSSSLEVWDIFSATDKNEPIFSASVETRFYALAWSKPFEGYSRGLLAAAFENGAVEFWDAEKLIKGKDLAKASVHKSTKHQGPVRTLQFNPIEPHVLVSGGSHGQIFIWDTKKFSEPFSPGQAMTPMDEISSVAWNNSVSQILASTGNSGYTSIWDLKSKRELLHLSYTGASGRANFSHVAWHPTQSTKLITASDNDSCPLILTWDLRNSNAPEKILEGHKKGVLSLDWCKQDPELLISSGKDNTTFLWNPITGEKLGEYPTTANWAFQTRFAPSAPDIFATASFDGKVIVQSLQDTSPPVSAKVTSNDDNVFWNQLSITDTQQPVFDIKQAPKWLKRPVSASFGFGSKLVLVKTDENGQSTVSIQKYSVTGSESSGDLFEAIKSNDFKTIIDNKVQEESVNAVDKSDWSLLKKLQEKGKEQLFREIDTDVKGSSTPKPEETKEKSETVKTKEDKPSVEDSFFDNLGNGNVTVPDDTFVPSGSFKIISDDASADDKAAIKLVLANRTEEAVTAFLEKGKLVEALLLALDGPEDVKKRVRNAYFKKNADNELSRILYNVSSKNVTDIVSNADVADWKEIAAGIASFASDSNEFNSKITELGDRILESNKDSKEHRDNAIMCYLAGTALDKIANIWLHELPEYEADLLKSDNAKHVSSPSEARLTSLTNFVQKIAAYRSISKTTGEISGPSAEPISKAILEYTTIVAGNGDFELAKLFLSLLPSEFAGNEKERIFKASGVAPEAAKSTSSKANVAAVAPGNGASAKTSHYGRTNAAFVSQPTPTSAAKSYQPPVSNIPPVAAPLNPPVAAPTSNPYARAISASNPYAPQASHNIYKAVATPSVPTAPPVGPPSSFAQPTSLVSPPPQAGPPSAQFKPSNEGWNDLPDTFKSKAPPRRAAPVATISPSPTPLPQVALPQVPKRSVSGGSAAPPPPKGLSRASSKTNVPTAHSSPRPAPVHINNKYAPPPIEVQVPVPNGSHSLNSPSLKKNPYAPPPEVSPNKIAYAPPPGAAGVVHPSGAFGGAIVSPPAPPKNPYAPGPAGIVSPRNSSAGIVPPPPRGVVSPPSSFSNIHGASHQPAFGGVHPPPPAIGQQPPASAPPPAAATPVVPEKPKYPAGDRTHIPEKSIAIYKSLSKVLEAIKPSIPEKYVVHGQDMEKRLNFLFDHLNNDDLLSDDAIAELKSISEAVEAKDFNTASALNTQLATNYSDQIGNWHRGVTRLITMAEAMY
ncbi:component of the COPII coat of ER-golgi vesicles [Scheffersomyces xylosifermentans]|uniref:component of the COPII coat of ER-golgi vesicles n=1 Tax=Scheffersomyces xylosifermentans TaxID=1304137 RepID=UPI00315D7FC6